LGDKPIPVNNDYHGIAVSLAVDNQADVPRMNRVVATTGGDDLPEFAADFSELVQRNYFGAPILFN
jgi:hypothetical protein